MWRILWTCIWRVSERSFNYLNYLPQLDFWRLFEGSSLIPWSRSKVYANRHKVLSIRLILGLCTFQITLLSQAPPQLKWIWYVLIDFVYASSNRNIWQLCLSLVSFHINTANKSVLGIHRVLCFHGFLSCSRRCIVGPSSCPPGRWSKRRLRWNSFAMPGVPAEWDRWLQCFVSVKVVAKTKDS